MAASGKGISAAVRGAIGEWMTADTIAILFDEYIRTSKLPKAYAMTDWQFSRRIREADEWVRIVRTRGIKGWIRTYYTKNFPDRNVTLEIKTNEADTHIEYVTVKVNGVIIGGGKVRVPSVFESQDGRKAKLKLDLAFIPFTKDQIKKLQAEMEFGDAAVMDLIFEERIV
jgi:hypothetical protein